MMGKDSQAIFRKTVELSKPCIDMQGTLMHKQQTGGTYRGQGVKYTCHLHPQLLVKIGISCNWRQLQLTMVLTLTRLEKCR